MFKLKSVNKLLLIAAVVSFVLTTLVCEIPFLATAFGFTSVGITDYLIAVGLGILVIPVVELVITVVLREPKDPARA